MSKSMPAAVTNVPRALVVYSLCRFLTCAAAVPSSA